jgi:signal transduction histidine kinase
MKKSEIEKGWLTISVSKKREMKALGQTTGKGRTPLGEKGLGRLSTQRLASKLEIFTNEKQEPNSYHVYFNWEDFTENTLLSEVNVEIVPLEKDSVKKGTRLALLDIKDAAVWQGDNAEKIKGKLSQLIYPKKRKRPFNIYLTISPHPIDLDYISEHIKETAVSRYSFTYYEGQIVILGQIKLAKLKGNDRANFTHLIEADNGKGFFDFISNPKNKKAFVSLDLKYSGEKGVFIEFKRTVGIEDIVGKFIIKNKDGKDIFLDPCNFRCKIDEYNFVKDTVDIAPLQKIFEEFEQYTLYIQNQTGIRVFRDGFGIRPFGLDGEDWLKLNQEQTSGSSFYGLRPGNVIGFVEISAKANPNLLEKTDREGIIDNFYYRNFYLINKRAISEINSLLESIKRGYNEYRKKFGITKTGLNNQVDVFNLMKKTGMDAEKLAIQAKNLDQQIEKVYKAVKDEVRSVSKGPLFSTSEDNRLKPLLENIQEQLESSQTLLTDLNSLLSNAAKLNEAVHVLEPQITTLQDQLAEFSELAGLGIIAESLSHEIDNVLDGLIQKSREATKYLKDNKITDTTLYAFIQSVNGSINALRKQASHLSPLLRYIREEKSNISVSHFVKELQAFYKERLSKNKIGFTIVKDSDDFVITMNQGKLTQVLDNIILNSEYWLKENLKTRKFNPTVTIKIKKPVVQIYDNGLGIDPAIEDRIFQPFTTTKPKKVGRGLGLFIVQQLLETSGCDIVLLPSKNEHGRRYIFQINFSTLIK